MRQKRKPVEVARVEHVRLPFILPQTESDEDDATEEEEFMRIEAEEALRRREGDRERTGGGSWVKNGVEMVTETPPTKAENWEKLGTDFLREGEGNILMTGLGRESVKRPHEGVDDNVTVPSDREVLLNYYNELLLQNEISECKRRKVSESDNLSSIINNSSQGILNLSVETRNGESALDSPLSSAGDQSDGDAVSPAKPPPTTTDSQPPTPPSPTLPSGPEQGSYPCPKCEKSFAYVGNLKRHIKMHHGEYRPFKCHLCVKRFWGNDSLEQHIKRVHSSEKPYECAHCDKKYSVCYDLQKHVRSVHGKDIDWSSSIPSKSTAEIPKTATGEKCKVTGIKTQALDQLNFKCKFCNRGFATVNGLGVHLKMHFRCKVCFKGFNTEESLKIHLQKAHDIVGDQEYVL